MAPYKNTLPRLSGPVPRRTSNVALSELPHPTRSLSELAALHHCPYRSGSRNQHPHCAAATLPSAHEQIDRMQVRHDQVPSLCSSCERAEGGTSMPSDLLCVHLGSTSHPPSHSLGTHVSVSIVTNRFLYPCRPLESAVAVPEQLIVGRLQTPGLPDDTGLIRISTVCQPKIGLSVCGLSIGPSRSIPSRCS